MNINDMLDTTPKNKTPLNVTEAAYHMMTALSDYLTKERNGTVAPEELATVAGVVAGALVGDAVSVAIATYPEIITKPDSFDKLLTILHTRTGSAYQQSADHCIANLMNKVHGR